jgi:predicted metal-dependent hydrolase
MSTEARQLVVNGLTISVVRKKIKNLHLGVYPPHGQVRVAVPLSVNDEAVRLAVIGKLGWIKRQRAQFAAQPRESQREMVSGESHYFRGRRYRLRVVHHDGAGHVVLRNQNTIELHAGRYSSPGQRERVLDAWYREQLKAQIPGLLKKWERVLGVEAADWGIKKMKTKWGACNIEARRIWLNLDLAKKSGRCLEYILVHELIHLLERNHNERFTGLMDRHLPQWRACRKELNAAPLGHVEWEY